MKNQTQKEAQRLIDTFGDKAPLVVKEILSYFNNTSDYLDSLYEDVNFIINNTKIEYIYNFVGGGWNTEWATSEKEAIKQAKKRWKGDDGLVVDTKSFRKSTKADMDNLLSMFY